MKVDLIIPTYKPGEKFKKSLKRLAQQTRKPDRIILINTEAQYFDEEMIRPYDNVEVHHIKKENFDHGATRDYGASLAEDADILMFMTDDAIPKDKYLVENLIKAFNDPKVSAAYGRQMADPKKNYIEYYTRIFNYPEESRIKRREDLDTLGIKTFFCSNVCSAYRKTDYDAMGGFEHKTIFNEDMIYAGWMVKKGYAVAYAAEAKVYHSHNYSCSQQFHRNFDLGVSQAEHPEVFEGVPSEGEGVRLVKKSLSYLLKTGHIWMIPGLFFQSASKYAGYFLGKRYQKLPERLILFCTMSPEYWKKQK